MRPTAECSASTDWIENNAIGFEQELKKAKQRHKQVIDKSYTVISGLYRTEESGP